MTLAERAPGAASQAATAVIAALLRARTGQQIADARAWRIETALAPLLRDRGIADLDVLVSQLLDGRHAGLAEAVVSALLNQESSFFRDAAVFDVMGEALTALAAEAGMRSLRIWSAGCSIGQEPLSLAMLLAARGVGPTASILATDVCEGALARARTGRYTQFEIQRGLPVRHMMDWFDQQGDLWVAKPVLTARIRYRLHNLVSDPAPPGGFDCILCRNVLLYFTPEVRGMVLDRLAGALRPGGVLMLGAGETVIGQCGAFVPSQRFRGLYTRRAEPGAVAAARA